MAVGTLETHDASDQGAVSRFTNTKRVFVGPDAIRTLAVTGTWVLEANTNVLSLATDDVGGAGELLIVPCPVPFSDQAVQQSAVNRGVRLVGCEIHYQVAVSTLADLDVFIYKTTLGVHGTAPSAAAVSHTDTNLDLDADEHRAEILIAEANRFFLDSGTVVHMILDIDDGTSSDVNIFGVVWHFEEYQD